MNKVCDTGPPVYRPYPRRLESLIICRCHFQDSTSSSGILRPERWSGRDSNSRPPAQQTGTLPTELTGRRLLSMYFLDYGYLYFTYLIQLFVSLSSAVYIVDHFTKFVACGRVELTYYKCSHPINGFLNGNQLGLLFFLTHWPVADPDLELRGGSVLIYLPCRPFSLQSFLLFLPKISGRGPGAGPPTPPP